MRLYLHVFTFLLLLATPGIGASPNILFIALDDLNDWIGCMGGHPQTLTPNLDRLADQGVLFSNAHCPGAACNPSRSAIMSGRSPHRSGLYANGQPMREVMPKDKLIPQHFRDHGYWAGGSGKMLHYFIDARSWDIYFPKKETESPFPRTLYPEQRPVNLPVGGPWQYKETDWAALDATDEEFGGDWLVSKWVGEQLTRKHNKPFFLACGIYRPHEPWFVPKKYFEPFPLESIQLPPGYKEDDLDDLPPAGKRRGPNRYFAHIQSHNQWKPAVQGYLASIHFADAMLGRVLDKLESGPHADNTIVVLWSDHGWHLGEKQHWQKYTGWRAVTRVPLMIKVPADCSPGLPAGTTAGQRCDRPVSLLSLAPTLSELAGLPIGPAADGPSLLPLLKKHDADWPHKAVTFLAEVGSYSLSADRFRYIHYNNGDEELYDIKTDPYEWTNLAPDPAQADTLARLRAQGPTRFAPKPISEKRPRLTIDNQRDETIHISWLPDNGPPRKGSPLAAGKNNTRTTYIGHRFLITGRESGFSTTIQVRKQKQTATIPADAPAEAGTRPNILVIMGDDWSAPHASILGDPVVQTPTFDRIAREGVLFKNAFANTPSCTASRFSVVSGQHPWRLGDAANLGGSLQQSIPVYPDLLAEAGYRTGYCRKGAAPSEHNHRRNDPLGTRYENFQQFLELRDEPTPFCFWYGAGEPHRPYDFNASADSDLDLRRIDVPACLPDNKTVRSDMGDYYLRIQKLDKLAGELLAELEQRGALENTIVVMTGDNGMPFPRCKATLYDGGTKVPLAIRWGAGIAHPGRTVDDFVGLVDLAPTVLKAIGLEIPAAMTGRELTPLLQSEQNGQIDATRSFVLTSRARHVYTWPARAIRNSDFLYIENNEPDTWETGRGNDTLPTYDFAKTPWPVKPPAFSFITDPSPTKQWMQQHPEHPLSKLAFTLPPPVELYDLANDPDQLTNLANQPAWLAKQRQLAKLLR